MQKPINSCFRVFGKLEYVSHTEECCLNVSSTLSFEGKPCLLDIISRINLLLEEAIALLLDTVALMTVKNTLEANPVKKLLFRLSISLRKRTHELSFFNKYFIDETSTF